MDLACQAHENGSKASALRELGFNVVAGFANWESTMLIPFVAKLGGVFHTCCFGWLNVLFSFTSPFC